MTAAFEASSRVNRSQNHTSLNYARAVAGLLMMALLAFGAVSGFAQGRISSETESRRQLLMPYFTPDQLSAITVTATDSTHEDRVEISWPGTSHPDVFWRVKRDGVLLTVLSSQDSSYSDASGIPGTVYTYSVALINAVAGDTIDVGDDDGSRIINPPENVLASDGLHEYGVRVDWTDRSGIEANYRVYRGGLLVATMPVNSESYIDSTAAKGLPGYTYCIRAVDALGRESQPACDTGWRGFAQPPRNVAASDGQFPEYVLVTWTAPAASHGFKLYRDNGLIATVGTDSSSFRDYAALSGQTYAYCLTSLDSLGQESIKICDTGGRGTLAAPTDVDATDGLFDDRVTISWADPGNAEDGFKVYRRDLGLPDSILVAVTDANITTYADGEAQPGKTYRYCVVAFSDSGAVSSADCDLGSRSVVLTPTSLRASDGTFEDYVDITWESASTTVVLFKVYRDNVVIQTVNGALRFARDYTGAPGISYSYTVRAVTALEDSSGAAVPEQGKRELKAATSLKAGDNTHESHVLISWNDNSLVETGYRIERKPVAGGSFALVGTTVANGKAYLDSTGAPGTEYTYRILAFDPKGVAPTGPTDNGSRSLKAPTAFSATDGNFENKILLSWLDNSSAETSYKVYRKMSAGLESLIATLAKNSTSFKDSTGVSFGVSYTYRLVAGDAWGTSSDISDNGYTAILPPGDVNASDTYADKVTVTWVDQSSIETGFIITRDGTRIGTATANATNFTDATAVAGTVHRYCVRDTTGTTQSAAVCDDGERVAVASGIPTLQMTEVADPGDILASAGISGVDAGYATLSVGGSVHFLRKKEGTWEEVQTLPGTNVDVDGDYAVVGDARANSNAGSVAFFNRSSTGWTQMVKYNGTAGLKLGAEVAISGGWAFVSAENGNNVYGVVYIYRFDGGTWTNVATISKPARQRYGAKMGIEGTRAIVTSVDSTYVYELFGNTWLQTATFGFVFGGNADTDIEDNVAVVATSGAVYVLEKSGNNWAKTFELPGLMLGTSVDRGSIFAYSGGQVRQYQKVQGTWTHVRTFATPGPTNFGTFGLDVNGGSIITGKDFKVFIFSIPDPPTELTASDDVYASRVQLNWKDNSLTEDGFRVYRDGDLVATLDPNSRSYSDADGDAGRTYRYSVVAFSSFGESDEAADFGRRPLDGAVNGRIVTRTGAGVENVEVCLDPAPSAALLFDGLSGGATLSAFEQGEPGLSAFTVEFWIRTRISAGNVFSYYLSGSNFVNIGMNGGQVELQINNDPTSKSALLVNDDRWHHVACTWGSNAGNINTFILVDGQLSSSTQRALGQSLSMGGILSFGHFAGQMDEVRVWKTTRSGAEVSANRSTPQSPEDPGLLLLLPLDDSGGLAAYDGAGRKQYAVLRGGAFWSSDAAPVQICGVTDIEGNYTIENIPYGQGATFKVVPALAGRQFEPAFKNLTIDPASPVQNEVAFTDISSFTLSGKVIFAGQTCAAESVQVLVDNVLAGMTDAEGNFAVAATYGNHDIKVQKGNRVFSPSSIPMNVTGDQSQLNFQDLTKHTLSGRAGGGCDHPVGMVYFEVRTPDGCFVTNDSTSTTFSLSLPPQKYRVRFLNVENVPPPLNRSEVFDFFDELGTREVDLSFGDGTIDFIYRAPLTVEIEGLPEPACPTLKLPNGTPIPAVGIIQQTELVPLTIRVFEDYGDGNPCLVDSGKVTIFDEIIDETDEPVTLEIENGEVHYTTAGNNPSIFGGRVDSEGNDRSYQKFLTAVVEVEGLPAVVATRWVIVTGHLPRTGTFVSGGGSEIPLLILRDPPGDGSSAFLEQGTTICGSWSKAHTVGGSLGVESVYQFGARFQKGTPFFATETVALLRAGGSLSVGFEVNRNRGLSWCATTSERITTSDADGIGLGGDVFMGVAMNWLFAKTDVVNVRNCRIERTESVALGADSIQTTYLYTAEHIEGTLIPQLKDLARLSPPDSARFNGSARNWGKMLRYNEDLKSRASLKENRSFSSGATYEAASTIDTTRISEWSDAVAVDASAWIGGEIEESGSGWGNKIIFNLNYSHEWGNTRDTTETRTVGYTLLDDDFGDYFSVSIYEEPVYGTPVFKTVSGRSSCPWEPNTQPRDSAYIAVDNPIQNDIPDGEDAVFKLSLANLSPSEEVRELLLVPVQTSNPGGAVIDVNANLFGDGLGFVLNPDVAQEVTMTVSRGPTKYRYDNLQLMLIPPCQRDAYSRTGNADLLLADTLTFSVRWKAPCSDITLYEPRGGWS